MEEEEDTFEVVVLEGVISPKYEFRIFVVLCGFLAQEACIPSLELQLPIFLSEGFRTHYEAQLSGAAASYSIRSGVEWEQV